MPISQFAFGPKAYKCKPIDIDALRQLLQVRNETNIFGNPSLEQSVTALSVSLTECSCVFVKKMHSFYQN